MTATPPATSPLDARLMLAMGVQAQPGTYALLLGSGVSTGAGIPTGWGIMTDLVRRAAIAAGMDETEVLAESFDPEAWWEQHQPGQKLNYSTLLDAVGGSTQSSRHGVLEKYFTATPEDVADGRKVPSRAHQAIAELVAGGYVRVVITTNFDNLLERALHDVGVHAQVISRPEQVKAMQPLAHAAATIVKLHGDVTETTKLNTPEELATYDPAWIELLDRIKHEYGLIICGWSGETDDALRNEIEQMPMRRYPLYWDSRSAKSVDATRILAQHAGQLVPAATADELFTSLAKSVASLAKMSEPPLTTAIAVAELKRAIGDPTRRVEVEDLVREAVRHCVREVAPRSQMTGTTYEELLRANFESAKRAVNLIVALTYYDHDLGYTDLWVEAVRDLMRARTASVQSQEAADKARLYPAALAVRAAGVLAVARDRPALALDLLRKPRASHPTNIAAHASAAQWLRDYRVFDDLQTKNLPGLKLSVVPASQHLRDVTYEFVASYFVDRDAYDLASDDYEFLVALFQSRSIELFGPTGRQWVSGVFMRDDAWISMHTLEAAARFRHTVDAMRADADWPLWPLLGGPDEAAQHIDEFETVLRQHWQDHLY